MDSMKVKSLTEIVRDGDMAENWKFYKKKFEIYLKATKLTNEGAEFKSALLLNPIGDCALRIPYIIIFCSRK